MIAKNIVFVANGIRLESALKSFSPTMESEELDATVLGTAGAFRSFVGGFKTGNMSLEGIWDADTVNADEIDDVMKAAFANQSVIHILASYGTIAIGDPALMVMDGKILGFDTTVEIGQLIMTNAEIRADNGIEGGKWHFDGTDTGAGVDDGPVDNAAATTNGGYYQGHLYQESDSAATNASFTLQHSTNGSTWADVEAAQSVGDDHGAVSREVTGTINRYTRMTFTSVGGKGYGVAAFARR